MPQRRKAGKSEPERGDLLVLNVGSSSLKFALHPLVEPSAPRWKGKIANLGSDDAVLSIGRTTANDGGSESLGPLDHPGALDVIMQRYAEVAAETGPGAVGHRVVHSGPHLTAPTLLDGEVIARLHAMDAYDPAHQAAELGCIETIAQRWPDVPQVACFDTTFHQTLPEVARRLPVSRADAARGLRRYGFHGLSYSHALEELRRLGGDRAANGRVLIAHLGSGASLAAVKAQRCVETTMGFTPTGGLPMSSRSGDIDPGVFLWLARHRALSAEAGFAAMTRQSGLRAISETTSDLRELLEREDHDGRAADAVAFFCHHVRKAIGALAAVLGGIDTLVFTGGVGEHQPEIRARACGGLEFLGVRLEPARNAADAAIISADGANATVRIIAADEERMIAQAVRDVLAVRTIAR